MLPLMHIWRVGVMKEVGRGTGKEEWCMCMLINVFLFLDSPTV